MCWIGKERFYKHWHKNLCFSVLIYSLQSVDIIFYILHDLTISVFSQRGFEWTGIYWANADQEANGFSYIPASRKRLGWFIQATGILSTRKLISKMASYIYEYFFERHLVSIPQMVAAVHWFLSQDFPRPIVLSKIAIAPTQLFQVQWDSAGLKQSRVITI